VLLVAAAGNSGGPVEHPARYGSVIAVSAIDAANQLASFSCRGPEVELCAPGVDVLSTVPGGGYARLSGTSMACPHVAGAPALAWSTHRFAPAGVALNVAIRRLLATTADNLGIPGRDDNFGFGRVGSPRNGARYRARTT
jgi:subtilisin